MARRSWDDAWRRYPASVPLPAKGGIATSKQRGQMAATWWSRRFVATLEGYGLGARMQRGRRYARSGQVLNLQVGSAVIAAQVQGSRTTPYLVTIAVGAPSETQWARIVEAMKAKVGFVARLVDGEVPSDLEEVFASCGVALFPAKWDDMKATCSCPDWENPCKHIAAVLYVFADRLDEDPWLVLELRGRQREALLDALAAGGSALASGRWQGTDASLEVAPWWPFTPGRPLPAITEPASQAALGAAAPPGRPDAVLDSLETLEVKVGEATLVEIVRPLYRHIVEPD